MRVMKLMNESDSLERRKVLMSHAEWLLKLGEGKIENVVQNIITIPDYMVCHNRAELQKMFSRNFLTTAEIIRQDIMLIFSILSIHQVFHLIICN